MSGLFPGDLMARKFPPPNQKQPVRPRERMTDHYACDGQCSLRGMGVNSAEAERASA